jgi:membrane protease YdiL (CAAX protease family)
VPRGPGGRAALFVVLAYALSWAWAIPLVAAGDVIEKGRGWPTHAPALLGPLLAAVLCTALTGRGALRELGRAMMRWRIGARWWLVAVSPAVALAVVVGVLTAVGADLPAWADFGEFSGLPAGWGVLGVALAIVLVNGFGEETGWRGYLQPVLQGRFGPVTATGIVAAVWAGWHLPQFFLVRTYRDFAPVMLPVFVVGLAAGAVVLAWLYNHTGSILACAVWHGLYNVTSATTAGSSGSGVISPAVWTFVVGWAVVLLVLERRATRAGRPSVLLPR